MQKDPAKYRSRIERIRIPCFVGLSKESYKAAADGTLLGTELEAEPHEGVLWRLFGEESARQLLVEGSRVERSAAWQPERAAPSS